MIAHQTVRRCDITVLGTFAVAVDGRAVSADSWRSRRAADLVKILAIEPAHRLHRDDVMDALWPELRPAAAGANLRKAVHYARRAMGSESAIEVDAGIMRLFPHVHLEVDLDAFLAVAKEALEHADQMACERAAALWTGEVLPSDRYEPWTDAARERTASAYVALLRASAQWERLLALDPADEAAHRALMEEYVQGGDRHAAIRQFERLRDALREHIGVGPDLTTVRLYEQVLDMEGPVPPSSAERAAATLANGLVAWGRRDLELAESHAIAARSLALDAELPHELGEASTLLALVAFARNNWHDRFRADFSDSVTRSSDLEMAVYDAHLCFQEFYLYGPDGHLGAEDFAIELYAIADRADSAAGRAIASLLRGEFALLNGDLANAHTLLERAVRLADVAQCSSAQSIARERLAEAAVASGELDVARSHLSRAQSLAEATNIPSHCVVRVLGIKVLAAANTIEALHVVRDAERWLQDAPRVCDPCSMTLRIGAAGTWARAGNPRRATRHIAEAERIAGLWQAGPWTPAIWEARAEVRRAEGALDQARGLLLEAADGFAGYHRPMDEARCRTAAAALVLG